MANHSLNSLTALGGDEPRVDTFDGLTIVENESHAFASLAMRVGKERPFNAAAKRAFKTALPSPGASTNKGNFTTFWAGQEQWYVEAPIESHEDIAGFLTSEFKESASITEQTGGWVRFDVAGDNCVTALERLCALDTATMEAGSASRSVIEHIGVFVLCRASQADFSIYGPRSSAGSLHHALTTAARSAI